MAQNHGANLKICIIGNSHIATLKRAWDAGSSHENQQHKITFFGAVRDKIMGLKADAGALVADDFELAKSMEFTSGGISRIDIANYDAVLVFGLCRKVHQPVEAMDPRFSSGLKRQAISGYWEGRNLVRMIRRIPAARTLKVYAGHSPLEARANAIAREAGQYREFIALSNRLVFSKFGATLLPQPAATIVGEVATAQKFSSGSLKLAVQSGTPKAHMDAEICHMNVEFGKLWLRGFLGAL